MDQLSQTPKDNLHERYRPLVQVQGSLGKPRVDLGEKGRCRFCDRTEGITFRKEAHTFPQGLGNRWVFSRDECDACNSLFSVYEDALIKCVSPFLTLGGVKGKSNKIRQTGRSAGRSVIARRDGAGLPKLTMVVKDAEISEHLRVDPLSRHFQAKMPVAPVPFKPRYAYKALAKMGFALLPPSEIQHYRKLREWLLNPGDSLDFSCLEVALSLASVGNAPPLIAGTLLQRINPADPIPYLVFVLSAGSLCFQIDLMSDNLEDHLPHTPVGAIKIRWVNILGDESGNEKVKVVYSDPVFMNWASASETAPPVEYFTMNFDTETLRGSFVPVFREGAIIR
jgi:hypothetical protein